MVSHSNSTNSAEPIRLFRSDFLEFFTHIHPAVIVILWGPVALYFLGYALLNRPPAQVALFIPVSWLIGLFLWTLAEYTLHRFLFHFRPRTPWQERVAFLFHGVHHAQPMVKTRLVMPPVVSIPLALLFYGLFAGGVGGLLGRPLWVAPLFAGFVTGYLAYDLTHYSLHHFKLKSGYFKFLRQYHMRHHAKTPTQRYGVTSPLWDIVFGTRPAD